jgi:hypothetical protein
VITAVQQASGAYLAGNTTATLKVFSNQVLSLFAGTLVPTLGAFTLPSILTVGSTYTITPPTSNSFGAFTYTSSNPTVASIVGNNSFIYNASGVTIITATQAAYGGYSSASVSSTIITTKFIYTTTAPIVIPNVVDSRDGNTYTNFIFTASGNIQLSNLSTNKNVYLLAVGGGGGGGGGVQGGGGGGGGGFMQTRIYPSNTDTLTITIGSGGSGGSTAVSSGTPGITGGNTTITSNNSNISITAYGGGGGAIPFNIPSGTIYGSTGGAGRGVGSTSYLAVTQTPSQNIGNGNTLTATYEGNHGGASLTVSWGGGGGGGGAGAIGMNGSSNGSQGGEIPGNGGSGAQYSLYGIASPYNGYYWAGGGGASRAGGIAANGGIGGGGGGNTPSGTTTAGGGSAINSGGNGTLALAGIGGANTGGGGGGGGSSQSASDGGVGGSGIVILMVQE